MFTLTISEGGARRAFQVPSGETVIGRAQTCGFVVNARGVSRQHARLRVAGGRVFLSDAGSTYGTTLNGKSLTAEAEIRPGDRFEVGEVTVTVEQAVAEKQLLSERTPVMQTSAPIVGPI